MNGFVPLGAFKRSVQERFDDVRQARFFRDRMSMALVAGALTVNGLNLFSLAMRVRPTGSQVPIRFSSLTLFDMLGPWYYPFLIALFALAVTAANGYFAFNSFGRSRLASFFLLVGAGVVAIFCFIISNAFAVVG